MDEEIVAIYKPKDGQPDDWRVGLVVDGDRLCQYLGDESPVLASIQTTGELLQEARLRVQDLEEESSDTDMDKAGDELCEALSRYARSPAMRFFNSMIANKSTVMAAIQKRAPEKFSQLPWTDTQYHALIVYCLSLQVLLMNMPSEEMIEEMIRCTEACQKARPNDASLHVMYGNFLMHKGFTQDAVDQLEKAVELNEESCFGAYYTIANICQNAVNLSTLNQLGPLETFQAQTFLNRCVVNLGKYLDLAPVGHWHVHRACMTLVLYNGVVKASKNGEDVASLAKRHPGFASESYATFQRGVQALRLYENCFGSEQSDFKLVYKQAASMIAQMHREGLLEGQEQLPQSEYICANPACTQSHWSEKPLLKCSRCLSVQYCGRECQTKHWKAGHKQECKRLGAERKQRREANPKKLKRPSVDTPQVGDDY